MRARAYPRLDGARPSCQCLDRAATAGLEAARSFHEHLHRCFDAFGPERMFWRIDITRMPCSWRQCVILFTEELPWLKGRDLDLVMGEAVYNWVGWTHPA